MEEDKNAFMKKLISLFLFFAFVTIFSQEYHFDYYINYKNEIRRDNIPELHFSNEIINSNDHSYAIRFTNGQDKGFVAKIHDFTSNVEHHFILKNIKFPLKSEDFIYQYSVKFPDVKNQFEEEIKRRTFNFQFIKNENDSDYYKIKEFKNNKLKKTRKEANVELQKFENDLSYIALRALFDAHEIDKQIKFEENYIVKSASNKFENYEIKLELIAVEPQDFEIKVSKNQLKFKNQ
ncbi:hypothetical protein ASG22_15190 [Chryseobacterium sp. Leaf405]|uniref:hypothetical protein n=1 Tax=Chryseobacterium sp. Leaf405 TaxID=1736367 RepID=UPI0006FF6BD4|nr:hypothetical protein [Chryseobacterium sp. Leaf405]KQT22598.1 hypothetical protein ASG22_15190 [Chryseobacterium sp. Leaf405]